MNAKHFSIKISIFHNVKAPEEDFLVGYAALIEAYKIGYAIAQDAGTHKYQKKQYRVENWQVLASRNQPKDSLYDQLVFALKYEGINLSPLRKYHLFDNEPYFTLNVFI
jgi:hypothetical protein